MAKRLKLTGRKFDPLHPAFATESRNHKSNHTDIYYRNIVRDLHEPTASKLERKLERELLAIV